VSWVARIFPTNVEMSSRDLQDEQFETVVVADVAVDGGGDEPFVPVAEVRHPVFDARRGVVEKHRALTTVIY